MRSAELRLHEEYNNSPESESCEDPTVYSSAVTYLFRFPNHSFDFFLLPADKKTFLRLQM